MGWTVVEITPLMAVKVVCSCGQELHRSTGVMNDLHLVCIDCGSVTEVRFVNLKGETAESKEQG